MRASFEQEKKRDEAGTEKSRRLPAMDCKREQLSIRGDMVRCPESEADTMEKTIKMRKRYEKD